MVKQGGEPILPPFLSCLSHTAQSLGHSFPALGRARVELNDVLLGPRPSLLCPRRGLLLFVRQIHRYYGAVRLLWNLPARSTANGLLGPVSILVGSRSFRDLLVLVHVVSQRRGFLDYAEPSGCSRSDAAIRVAFPVGDSVGVSEGILFEAQLPGPTDALVYAPTKTLRSSSQDSGSGWSRFSFPVGLFHPLQHAGLIPAHPP